MERSSSGAASSAGDIYLPIAPLHLPYISGATSSAGPQRSGLPPTELSRIPLPPRPAQRKAAAGGGAGGGGGNPKRL